MGQLLLKGLFITVTSLRFHPSLPSGDVTRPHRNNVAHPRKPTPSNIYTNTRLWRQRVQSKHGQLHQLACKLSALTAIDFLLDDFAETKTASIKYLQHSNTRCSFSARLLYWSQPQLSTFLKHYIKWIPPLLDNKYRKLAKSCYSSAWGDSRLLLHHHQH